MRKETIELVLLNGEVRYMDSSEFTSAGVKEKGISVINQYLRGSRGATIKVNALEDLTGEESYVNVNHITEIKVTYK